MVVGVSHDVTGSMRYQWNVPNPATLKEIHKAIGWAESVANDVGVATNYDNWLMLRYDEDANEMQFYFDIDLGRVDHNARLQLLEYKQRKNDADK